MEKGGAWENKEAAPCFSEEEVVKTGKGEGDCNKERGRKVQ